MRRAAISRPSRTHPLPASGIEPSASRLESYYKTQTTRRGDPRAMQVYEKFFNADILFSYVLDELALLVFPSEA